MFKEAVARACSYSWAESSGANSATLHVAYMYFEKLIDADTDQRTLEQVISILDALRSRNGSLKKHKVGDFQIISQKFQQTLAYLKQSGAFPKTIAFSAVVESIKTETDRLSAQEAQRKELEQGYHAINKARTLLRMFRSEGMNIDRMKKEKAKYDVTMEAFRRKHAGGGQVGNVKQRQQVAELEKRIQDIFDQAVLRSGSKT
jgi:DNA gyrase inhibitor GyrI